MRQEQLRLGNALQSKDGQRNRSGAIRALVAGLVAWVMLGFELARQRRQLAALDDRTLKDIGLTRADVTFESDKPFWRG